jgi:hypothetical protein
MHLTMFLIIALAMISAFNGQGGTAPSTSIIPPSSYDTLGDDHILMATEIVDEAPVSSWTEVAEIDHIRDVDNLSAVTPTANEAAATWTDIPLIDHVRDVDKLPATPTIKSLSFKLDTTVTTTTSTSHTTHTTTSVTTNTTSTTTTTSEYWYPGSYALCSTRFNLQREDLKEQHGSLGVLDFAEFAGLTNFDNNSFAFWMHYKFPGWQLVHQHRPKTDQTGSSDYTTFFELSDPYNTTTVFAIRGTQGSLDFLEDLNIWSPVAITQIAGLIGPNVHIVAARAVAAISHLLDLDWYPKEYYKDLRNYVIERIRADPKRRYLFTGHSLGGGIAEFVALEVGRVAVTFSAPGVLDTAHMLFRDFGKFAGNKSLEYRGPRYLYNVQPAGDLVPEVDYQVGTTMKIGCLRSTPMQCHRLEETVAELQRGGCKRLSPGPPPGPPR